MVRNSRAALVNPIMALASPCAPRQHAGVDNGSVVLDALGWRSEMDQTLVFDEVPDPGGEDVAADEAIGGLIDDIPAYEDRGRRLAAMARGSMDPFFESMVLDYMDAEEDLRDARRRAVSSGVFGPELAASARRAAEAEVMLRERIGSRRRRRTLAPGVDFMPAPPLAMGSGTHAPGPPRRTLFRRAIDRFLGRSGVADATPPDRRFGSP